MKKPFKGTFAILIILLSFIPAIAGHGSDADLPPGASDEEREINAAARKYLDAEVARDLKTVYDCLAPSSIYRATHDRDAYLAEAGVSPVRIREYQILQITHIRVNEDKKTYPRVEKFAQVEVDVQFLYIDSGETAEVNFAFTFIREGGHWYKG